MSLSGPQEVSTTGLHRHLEDSLKAAGKRYRRQMERCRDKFSETAVHDLRVEIRRLLALVEMIGIFVPARRRKKAARLLKAQFDVFDDLRDTQAQALRVRAMARRQAGARRYQDHLCRHERRGIRKAAKAIGEFHLARARKLVEDFRAELRSRRKQGLENEDWARLWQSVRGAYAKTAVFNQAISRADTRTIHRTRIAFKKYRYMIEALAPLLRGASPTRLRALHAHQTLMGDVQDLEVLITGVDNFLRKGKPGSGEVRSFMAGLEGRRQTAIASFLKAADRLSTFAPEQFLGARRISK